MMGTVLRSFSRSKSASFISKNPLFADWRFGPKLEQCRPRGVDALGRRRNVSSSHSGAVAVKSSGEAEAPLSPPESAAKMPPKRAPLILPLPLPLPALAILPFPNLVRSYVFATVSSSPFLLRASLRILGLLARGRGRGRSPLMNPDRNPLLHFLLKRTLYAQFCAGETADEVDRTVTRLKGMGYTGVMLGYAREACTSESEAKNLGGEKARCGERLDIDEDDEDDEDDDEISSWAERALATINMVQPGDFVSLKLTGLGTHALQRLAQDAPASPSPTIDKAITDVCEMAKARRVRLLFDAEQHAVQAGIDSWTIAYMKQYNGGGGNALVYGTYQAYKRSTPGNLAKHLDLARRQNFTLGVKLVRGAYLGSDPRNLFWDTIDDTGEAYDGIAESLMRRAYNETLRPVSPHVHDAFPSINLVLASHNGDSLLQAQKIRDSQLSTRQPRVELAYGQLMGMAEDVSCGLVQAGRRAARQSQSQSQYQYQCQYGEEGEGEGEGVGCDIPNVYQYLVWGSVGECCQYLLRRAEENKDAILRTKESRKALGRELFRRLGSNVPALRGWGWGDGDEVR